MKLIALALLFLAPLPSQERSQQQPPGVTPKAPKIYVLGNVKKPGVYEVHTGDHMTVMTALALAEGVLASSPKKAFIYRRNAGSDKSVAREEIPVDLSKVLSRKLADVALQPDDILYIPQSAKSRLASMGVPVKGTPPFQIPIDWWQGS